MLTPEQREVAIELLDLAIGEYREEAESALDALLEEFVVIAKDDVTEELGPVAFSMAPGHDYARLVTRWEPITNTKEENDG
jgi:hypothetical protein